MKTVLILFALISITLAFNCFHTSFPSLKDDRPRLVGCATHCVKITGQGGSGGPTYSYGCDERGLCKAIAEGQCVNKNTAGVNVNTCCCTGELCNSGDYFKPMGILSIVISYFLL